MAWLECFNLLLLVLSASGAEDEFRLPINLVPTLYDIELIPYLDPELSPANKLNTFEGRATIRLICKEVTNMVILHAVNIEIESKKAIRMLSVMPAQDLPVKNFSFNPDRQTLEIEMEEWLEYSASLILKIEFRGRLDKEGFGFYRSSYWEDGMEKFAALTNFAPVGARQAFPCFDEPGLKAAFIIKIAHTANYTVTGSLKVESDDVELPNLPGWRWAEFPMSKDMSTHFVAFAVHSFSKIASGGQADLEFSLWARDEAVATGSYANNLAPIVLQSLTDFTGQGSGLGKLDQIAAPDLVVEALGSWGLLLHRENFLLLNDSQASAWDKQMISLSVAQQLARQWFGNLMTPKWWDSLWLSEGFANYLSYKMIGQLNDWDMDAQFIFEILESAFETDSLNSTHALIADVGSLADIYAMLDSEVTTKKGGVIARFLVLLMGEDNFRKGVFNYIENFKYGIVESNNLWWALDTFVPYSHLPYGKRLKEVFEPWTVLEGFPVLTVERLYDTKNRAIISQKKFKPLNTSTTYEEPWPMPITMTNGAERDFANLTVHAWLTTSNAVLEDVADDDDWLIVNLRRMGFFRVNYDERNWKMLMDAIDGAERLERIDAVGRAQLVSDALALARARLLPYPLALDVTSFLRHETEYLPWATALASLGFVRDRLAHEEDAKAFFESFVTNKLKPIYDRLGGVGSASEGDEDHLTGLLRSTIVSWACKLGHEQCVNHSKQLFDIWRLIPNPDQENPIHVNARSVVYCEGVKNGNRADWDFLFERFLEADAATVRVTVLEALGCSTDPDTLQNYLENLLLETSPIRRHDFKTVLMAAMNSQAALVLDFLIEHSAQLPMALLGNVFTDLARKLNAPEDRQKLQKFYDDNHASLGASGVDVLRALGTLDSILDWHEQHKRTVVAYLQAKSSTAGRIPVSLGLSALIVLATRFL